MALSNLPKRQKNSDSDHRSRQSITEHGKTISAMDQRMFDCSRRIRQKQSHSYSGEGGDPGQSECIQYQAVKTRAELGLRDRQRRALSVMTAGTKKPNVTGTAHMMEAIAAGSAMQWLRRHGRALSGVASAAAMAALNENISSTKISRQVASWPAATGSPRESQAR